MASSIPTIDDPVEIEHLQTILNDYFGTVETICGISAFKMTQGFLSETARVDIKWKENICGVKLPQSVVVKTPSIKKLNGLNANSNVDTVMIMKMHNTEVDAYRCFQVHYTGITTVPRCYHAQYMTENATGLLILEYIDGKSMDFKDSGRVEQILAIAESLAHMHAHSFIHPDSISTVPDALPFSAIDLYKDKILPAAAVMRSKFPEIFTVNDLRVQEAVTVIRRALKIMLAPKQTKYVKTLVHGDLQPSNVIWKVNPSDGSRMDDIAAIIDFQNCHQGVCFYDITGIICWSLTAEDHNRYIDDIFNHYYKILEKTMVNSKPPVSQSEILSGYKIMRLMMCAVMIPVINEMSQNKERFGFSPERANQLVGTIQSGFDYIRSDDIQRFLHD